MSIAASELLATEILRGANQVVVLTGAGMSAESGIPTFRDALTGIWSRFDPEDLATVAAFRRRPNEVFAWYVGRLRQARRVVPHAGYHALVTLERHFGVLPIVTQNVDGLHTRAGSTEVVELHGSLEAFRCLDCGHPVSVETVLVPEPAADGPSIDAPICDECGSLVRPGVVWFGEVLPATAVERAWQLAERADVVVVVGTSSMVYPAAELPLRAKLAGAKVIAINPQSTPMTASADVFLGAAAGQVLPRLATAVVG